MQPSIVQEYIDMRNSKQFNLQIFWKMYQSEGGVLKNPQDFSNHFLHEVQDLGNGMKVRVNRDRDAILNGVDTKLELTILYDKQGQFLGVVN